MSCDTNHAERFMNFVKTLDRVAKGSQLKVVELLDKLLEDDKVTKEYGTKKCWYSSIKDKDKDGGNPRRGIPAAIIQEIRKLESPEWNPVDKAKVPHTWISCYVYEGLYPDQSKQGWKCFQCSHLCTLGECVNPNHLCWESASVNQGRGKGICSMKCKHDNCGECLCKCQKIHDPPCVLK